MAEERRVQLEEHRYAIMTKESIKMMAESAGFEEICDSVAGILGEDLGYRMREMTQKGAQFMRHARRKRMNMDDFNKACRHSDIQPVYGHGSLEPPLPFRPVRDGDFHFVEDPVLNLAAVAVSDYVPKQLGDTSIKAHWLAVEGVQKSVQNPQGSQNNKVEPCEVLMQYVDKITQSILGYDSEMMKTALADLRTNANISPLLPHFISFIANGVQAVSHDTRQLTKLLYTIQSLLYNGSLFLEAQPYLPLLLQSVQFCLLEPLAVSGATLDDHWTLRDYAARLLALIVSVWSNPINQLERFTEKKLREVLYDHNKPYCSHYGAVMGQLFLGSETIERVLLPHLSQYWTHLNADLEYKGMESELVQRDACKVQGAILLCIEHVLREKLKQFKEQHICENKVSEHQDIAADLPRKTNSRAARTSNFMSLFDKSPIKFYSELTEYFGDSLILRLPELFEVKNTVFKPARKKVVTTIVDPETHKSGEELLAELMEQVKQDEIGNKQKSEQKKCLQEKLPMTLIDQRMPRPVKLENPAGSDQRMPVVPLQKQLQPVVGSDDEIDVEGVNVHEKIDNSLQSDKFEEDITNVSLAVKSSVCAPGQGIKLTFTKKKRFNLEENINWSDSPLSDASDKKDKGIKKSKKSEI